MNKRVLLSSSFIIVCIIILIITLIDKEEDLNSIYVSQNDCDAQKKTCKIKLKNFSVDISIDKNIYYLKKFKVGVSLSKNENISSMHIHFKMKNMNMGKNQFILKNIVSENKKYYWSANALLPICVAGRADWFSELIIVTGNNKFIIEFPILVSNISN